MFKNMYNVTFAGSGIGGGYGAAMSGNIDGKLRRECLLNFIGGLILLVL